jgi:hypothetical protein
LTLIPFDNTFTIESANAQGGGGGHGGSSGMDSGGGGHGGSSGMDSGGGGHGMEVPGMVQQICHMDKDMAPHYCEPNYNVMSSVKGLKISDVNPINDNELQVFITNMNSVSNATTATDQQNIVIVGGGGDLTGSTVLDIAGSQKITTELKLIGSGSIYNLEKISLHLFPLTSQ